MEPNSSLLAIFFGMITGLTVWQFYRAAGRSPLVLGVLAGWMLLQAAVALSGFYQDFDALPPRPVFLVGPSLLFILVLFLTPKGRAFIDGLDLKALTLLHTIRIPVEIMLYLAYTASLVPMAMTFEGSNFDILSGLTAPVIYYTVFVSRKNGRYGLLYWNIICLGLLLNIVTIAILSARTPFQQMAFDQPNILVAYFPYVWLPGVIVPLVLFSHLAAIRQILYRKEGIFGV